MKLGFTTKQLCQFANQLGSDQAFFFYPAAARCRGRGEKVEPLSGFKRLWIVIGMPPQGLDTGDVFRQVAASASSTDETRDVKRSGESFCRNWNELTTSQLAGRLFNRLQPAARTLSPWIDRLANEFANVNCRGHLMSGSGSSYFGIFNRKHEALIATQRLRNRMPCSRFFMVPTIRSQQERHQLAS